MYLEDARAPKKHSNSFFVGESSLKESNEDYQVMHLQQGNEKRKDLPSSSHKEVRRMISLQFPHNGFLTSQFKI